MELQESRSLARGFMPAQWFCKIFPVLTLFLSSYMGFSQIRTQGSVTDSDDFPLIGATVVIKGTQIGTITNVDGKFSLEVPSVGDTLLFSYVGYAPQEIIFQGQTAIDVSLDYDQESLEEVVVVGYGTQRRRDLTGSVVSVDEKRFQDIPATNLTSALQGSVSGVSINTASGAPGSGSNILIRGVQSLLANNDPLVIVDGMFGASIDDIHPNDIASIEVLKDAAATSIYGSRASSGVILVTTKKGKPGKPSVNYNGYYGFSKLANEVDVLTAEEYVAKLREINRMNRSSIRSGDTTMMSLEESQQYPIDKLLKGNELNMYNRLYSEDDMAWSGDGYNWLEEVTRSAPIQNHNLSVSGGDENTRYFLSASFVDQTGVIHNSDYQRQSIRGNISSWITSWLKVGTNVLVNKSTQHNVAGEIFRSSYQLSPLGQKFINEDSASEYALYPMDPDEFIASPFTEIRIIDKRENFNLLNSTFLEFSPFDGFSYQIQFNSVYRFYRNYRFTPLNTRQVRAFDKAENGSVTSDHDVRLNMNNIVSYTRNFDKHRLTGTFVYATEEEREDDHYSYARNFGTDYYQWTALEYGERDFTQVNTGEHRAFMVSYIGRFNYAYDDKYLLQVSVRQDKSSRFSKENQDATFPAVSLGWVVSEEGFMKALAPINNLKLRFSWARAGNQAIEPTDRFNEGREVYYTTGGDGEGSIVEGLVQTGLANKGLRWELSEEYNYAIDFQLFNSRISGTAETYRRTTTDLLFDRPISSLTGFTSIRDNIGSLQNKGVEFTLNGIVVDQRDFSISLTANYTRNQNKVLDLDGTKTDNITANLFIGEPVGVIRDWVFDGILQEGEEAPLHQPGLQPGEVKVKNIGSYTELEDGTQVFSNQLDSAITDADKTIVGQSHPKWYGSFGLNAKYKKFDLSVFVNHVAGVTRRIPVDVSQRPHSMDIPYYTDENPSTKYPRPAYISSPGRIDLPDTYEHLAYYVDASYTRLQNVTLGYTMSNNFLDKIEIEKIRFYLSGQNLFTITDYLGYDPSPTFDSDSNQTEANIAQLQGYPTIKNIIFGMNVTF